MASSIEKVIASTFMEMAQGLESGQYGRRPKIALTGMGSEHGEENSMQAAVMAAKQVWMYTTSVLWKQKA